MFPLQTIFNIAKFQSTQATASLVSQLNPYFVYLKFFNLKLSKKDLKDHLAELVPAEQKRVGDFKKKYGAMKLGEYTIDMVIINDLL